MTIEELEEKWLEVCRVKELDGSSAELRLRYHGTHWIERGGGTKLAGADLESAVRGLVAIVEGT